MEPWCKADRGRGQDKAPPTVGWGVRGTWHPWQSLLCHLNIFRGHLAQILSLDLKKMSEIMIMLSYGWTSEASYQVKKDRCKAKHHGLCESLGENGWKRQIRESRKGGLRDGSARHLTSNLMA